MHFILPRIHKTILYPFLFIFLHLMHYSHFDLSNPPPFPQFPPAPAHAFTHMSGIESDIFQQALLPISHC